MTKEKKEALGEVASSIVDVLDLTVTGKIIKIVGTGAKFISTDNNDELTKLIKEELLDSQEAKNIDEYAIISIKNAIKAKISEKTLMQHYNDHEKLVDELMGERPLMGTEWSARRRFAKKTVDIIYANLDNFVPTSKLVLKVLEMLNEQKITLLALESLRNDLPNFVKSLIATSASHTYSKSVKEKLWHSSQQAYLFSHSKGNRFYSLNIIQQLLPQGYISDMSFSPQGTIEDGDTKPILNYCKFSDENLAIIGVGGIGKTTFLQQILHDIFISETGDISEYTQKTIVPFFIELNRCPEHIKDWYDSSYQKTNFITRYIGQMVENHRSIDNVGQDTLIEIEKEFSKKTSDGSKEYLLLLDGFNEVSANNSVRTFLSNEISVLNEMPNVRVITTSRETQAAYYASNFTNIRLVGLDVEDIQSYLQSCHVAEPVIGNTMACGPLMECLKIPLYLCMFSAEDMSDGFLPETAGEILYCFFHRKSAFYNARERLNKTRNNTLSTKQTAFVFDFVLPFIGWAFEKRDTFSMNATKFAEVIEDSMSYIKSIYLSCKNCTLSDFEYNTETLKNVYNSFYKEDGKLKIDLILICIYDQLGIVYRFEDATERHSERIRYAFCHHHFRDYFSAFWDVQLLSSLQCLLSWDFSDIPTNSLESYHYFLNSYYWPVSKISFISQILMEHRNQPQFNLNTKNWRLPKEDNEEQCVLRKSLDFCRILTKNDIDIHYLLRNILAVISDGRKDFSGLNLSGLNFENYSFFNMNCSKRGKNKVLAAIFDGCTLSENNFKSQNHYDNIIEYLYHNNRCYTIDDTGLIKCWDTISGTVEFELHSADPSWFDDITNNSYIKISNDGHWLAAKVQESSPDGIILYVNIFDLKKTKDSPKQFFANEKYKRISSFNFTDDSQNLLILFDNTVYCFDIQTNKKIYDQQFTFFKHTELFAASGLSKIYAYTAEYDSLSVNPYGGWEDYEEEDRIYCKIRELCPYNQTEQTIYRFTGAFGTSPTVKYLSHNCSFLLFNYDKNCIERFECKSHSVIPVFEELTCENNVPPSAIHQSMDNKDVYFVMYPDVCFEGTIDIYGYSSILKEYFISGVAKLLSDSGSYEELHFLTSVAPSNNRFLIRNDINTYEWDTKNETLNLRYNCVFYNCTDLLVDEMRNLVILVHQYNGVTIFSGNPLKLENQFCFQEIGYFIGNACYNENCALLAMTFVRADHEKVMILDLTTGEHKFVYSTLHKSESIQNLCFDDSGEYILISTQYQCLEYEISHPNKRLNLVTEAFENERLAMVYYTNKEIEVVVVEHSCVATPRIDSRCDFYKRISGDEKNNYVRQWYYILPTLKEELYKYFIYQHNDLGTESSYNEGGIQSYWVTRGFFLEDLHKLNQITTLECYVRQGDTFIKTDRKLYPLDMICVRHYFDLTRNSKNGESKICCTYLSNDMKRGIFTEKGERLSYQKNLHTLTYKTLKKDFNRNIGDDDGHAYWDFAIPWVDGNLIGCYGFFHLIGIDLITGKLTEEITYYPGISIYSCNFKNASIDEVSKSIITHNGGLL